MTIPASRVDRPVPDSNRPIPNVNRGKTEELDMRMTDARSETAIEPPRVRTLDMKPERRCSDKRNNAFKARNPTMTKFRLVLTIASLSIVNAGFALAQAAVQEPGAYAFYHPDGDVL